MFLMPGSRAQRLRLPSRYAKTGLAVLQANLTTPAATVSGAPVMMGLGSTARITPVYHSRVFFVFLGVVGNTVSLNSVQLSMRFGTGTAPVNGAAASGTQIGTTLNDAVSGASATHTTAVSGLATGLTPGTQYWFDVAIAVGGGTSIFQNLSCSAFEL